MLALRSIFFTLLLPGTVTVLVPYLIVSGTGAASAPRPLVAWAGAAPVVVGAGVLLRCILDFAAAGRGTLAPVDPPTVLVVRGLYRYVRNPMYVGVVWVLVGEALLFWSVALLVYAAVFFAMAHAFVTLYEEPALRRRFGASYEAYARDVRRWLPRRPRRLDG